MGESIYGIGHTNAKVYSPSSEDVNFDVLKLAQRFQLQELTMQASRWMLKGLKTTNCSADSRQAKRSACSTYVDALLSSCLPILKRCFCWRKTQTSSRCQWC